MGSSHKLILINLRLRLYGICNQTISTDSSATDSNSSSGPFSTFCSFRYYSVTGAPRPTANDIPPTRDRHGPSSLVVSWGDSRRCRTYWSISQYSATFHSGLYFTSPRFSCRIYPETTQVEDTTELSGTASNSFGLLHAMIWYSSSNGGRCLVWLEHRHAIDSDSSLTATGPLSSIQFAIHQESTSSRSPCCCISHLQYASLFALQRWIDIGFCN